MPDKEHASAIKLHMECRMHSIALHLICEDNRVNLRQLMNHSKYDCLIPPSQLVEEPGGQTCSIFFNVSECKQLLRRPDGVFSENAPVNLNEGMVRSFVRSVAALVHDKYDRIHQSTKALPWHPQSSNSPEHSAQGGPPSSGYLGLVSPEHTYLDSDGALKMVSPLFYCDDRLCWAIGLQHGCGTEQFRDNTLGLNPVETELFVLGKLVHEYLLATPLSHSAFSVSLCDLMLAEFKHRDCSQRLKDLLSALSDTHTGPQHTCFRLPELVYMDSRLLLFLDEGLDEEPKDAQASPAETSPAIELRKFLCVAKCFCMNTLHAPSGPVIELLAFLTNHANVLSLIDHLFQSLDSREGAPFILDPSNEPPNSYTTDLLDNFCVLLRHDFGTFTLHEFLLTDPVLSRRLLLIPEKFSEVYAYAFCQIVTTLLKTQPTSRSLLLTFANQPVLLETIVSNIWHDDIFTSLFNIIDMLSKPDNAELHPLLVQCMKQIDVCSRLTSLAQQTDCMAMLSAAMQIYDQLLNSRVPGLLVLTIDCLPMILAVIDSSTLDVSLTKEVSETESLLTTGYLNCCGRVFSVGLSLMLKTSLQLFSKTSPLTPEESVLKETIENVYPRIRAGLCNLAQRLSLFVTKMVASYPADATHLYPPKAINYLYSCLVFCARLFSTSSDLKNYLHFKNNITRGNADLNLMNKTRSFPGNIVEPVLEVALPFSAKAGAGGPSQILISQTYLSKEGHALLISLHCLIEAFLSNEMRMEICKIFCVYPNATMLHYAVSRIFIPCIELFTSEVDKLEIILSKSAFITVGQHFLSTYDPQQKRWSSGLVHYINLLKSLIRISAGVSDQNIFPPEYNTTSKKPMHSILQWYASGPILLSIKSLASKSDGCSSIPAVKYLLGNPELVSLSECFLDTERETTIVYTSPDRSIESSNEYTDSSDIAELPADNINLAISGDASDPIPGLPSRSKTRHSRLNIVDGQNILIDCLIPLRIEASQSSDD